MMTVFIVGVIGCVLALAGYGCLVLYWVTHTGGYKTEASLLGVISRQSSDSAKPSLHMVVRYQSPSGRAHIDTASEWLAAKGLSTGMVLNVIVHSHREYPDIYFSDNRRMLHVGLGLVALGLLMLLFKPIPFLVPVLLSIILSIVALPIVHYLRSIDASNMPLPDYKVFQLSEILPIEKIPRGS